MKKCEMFCYQCQETARGTGCTKVGVCGKRPELSSMLDLLIYVTKGLSCVTTKLREEGKEIGKDVNHLVTVNLFTTITNANFDRDAIVARIKETLKVKEDLRSKLTDLDSLPEAALWNGSESEFDAKADSDAVGVLSTENEDIRSLREMITYGLKGLAAYSKHANALMQDNEKIDAFLQRALAKTLDDSLTVDDLVALTLETGKFGVDGMALLDSANTGAYGNPEITEVNIGVRNNPGILISGHDLKDLEQLLEQTNGTGVDVYTHSEMLPAHYYPAFKKYDHFAGNYGNAWWKQKEEFETFNGPILMTTNCIVPPADSYKDRLWTTGAAGYPGCRHIEGEYGTVKDFSAIIEQAKTCAPPQEIETGSIIGGFAHEQVFALADKVVEAIKSGAIRKFVVMAGSSVSEIGLVESGSVNIVVNFYWGNSHIFGHVGKGQVFAENYAAIPGKELLCDVVACEETEVLFLSMRNMLTTCPRGCAFHTRIIQNMLRISAQKNLNLSSRMMHTASKSLRERLLSYLSEQALEHRSSRFTIPFDRQQLADYLAVDRSAMSNELSKMQKDGLITYHKNEFTLNGST